jgi:hypothetical protein
VISATPALSSLAVLADHRALRRFGQGEDRHADALGEVIAHEEVDLGGAQLIGELVSRRAGSFLRFGSWTGGLVVPGDRNNVLVRRRHADRTVELHGYEQ